MSPPFMTLNGRYLAYSHLKTGVFAQNRPWLGSWFAGARLHGLGLRGYFQATM